MHCEQCKCMKFAMRQTSVSQTLQRLSKQVFCTVRSVVTVLQGDYGMNISHYAIYILEIVGATAVYGAVYGCVRPPCGRIWNSPLQVKDVNGQPQADRKSKDSWMLLCALRRCLDQIQGSNHRKHECRKHQYAKELEAILTNRQVYKPIF